MNSISNVISWISIAFVKAVSYATNMTTWLVNELMHYSEKNPKKNDALMAHGDME